MQYVNSVSRFSRFGSGGVILRAKVGESLSDELIQERCPSVFAATPHASRSDQYTYLPTSDLLGGLRGEGFFPVEIRQGGSRDADKRGFTKHMIRLRRDLQALRRVGDGVPEVVLLNSHDGTCAYCVLLGWFRLICANGMIAADGDKATGIRVGHRGDVLSGVIEASHRIAADSEKMLPLIEDMTRLWLTEGEQVAFATAAKALRFDDDAEIPPSEIIRPRRDGDVGSDLWRVFNRAQENLVNGGIAYRTKDANGRRLHRRARELKGIEANIRLNQSLWALAEDTRNLKMAA